MKRFMLLAALVALAMLVLEPAAFGQSRGPSGADGSYNCPDFDTQEQAQTFFNSAGAGDPNGLDADSDGQACEDSLPPDEGGTGGGMTQPTPTRPTTTQQPATTTQPGALMESGGTGLPSTGGPAPLLPISAGLLLAGGLGVALLRRR